MKVAMEVEKAVTLGLKTTHWDDEYKVTVFENGKYNEDASVYESCKAYAVEQASFLIKFYNSKGYVVSLTKTLQIALQRGCSTRNAAKLPIQKGCDTFRKDNKHCGACAFA